MKKLCSFILSFALIFALSIGALADYDYGGNTFETAGDLFLYWTEHGYPDYVGGVWSTDGSVRNMTVSLVDSSAQSEILELIENDDTVKFETASYSRNELMALQKELDMYFDRGVGLFSTSLDDIGNAVTLGLDLDNETDAMREFMDMCTERYGGMVKFENSGKPMIEIEGGNNAIPISGVVEDDAPNLTGSVWLVLLLGLAVGAYLIFSSRRSAVMDTGSGNITSSEKLSIHEVKELVGTSNIEPTAELDEKIMRHIDK